jgi:hypothetical protein
VALTREDRERINDSRLKIQSITNALDGVNSTKIPEYAEIQDCLESAEHNLQEALQDASVKPPS